MRSGLRRLARPRNATPVPLGNAASSYQVSSLLGGGGDRETYMRAYGQVGSIFSIVSLYAQGTARPTWQLFRSSTADANRYTTRDEGSDQRQQIFTHPALTLWNQPNPFYSGFALRELCQTYLDLTGECYLIVERAPGSSMPIHLWPVRPDRMEPVPDPVNYLAGWVYTAPDGRQQVPLGVDEVLSMRYPNPLDPYHGLGPVQSVLVDIDAAKYSAEWNRNYFLNSAEPNGVISYQAKLSDDDFRTLMNRWRESHRGVARAHRVAVLEGGATWSPAEHSARDMDFANLRNLSRDVFREAFRMHKVMVGVSDDVNRANAQTGEEVFSSWGIVPRLDRWRDMGNTQLLPMFGSLGVGVECDYVTPVPPNREQDNAELTSKSQAALVLVQAGYDPQAVLEVIGLPDMPSISIPPPGGLPVGTPGVPGGVTPAQQSESAGSGVSDMDLRHLIAPFNQLAGGRS